MNPPYSYITDFYLYQAENGNRYGIFFRVVKFDIKSYFYLDQQVQQSPISFNEQTLSLDDIDVDGRLKKILFILNF